MLPQIPSQSHPIHCCFSKKDVVLLGHDFYLFGHVVIVENLFLKKSGHHGSTIAH